MSAEFTIIDRIRIPLAEIELEAVRSLGHGGKTSTKSVSRGIWSVQA